MNLTDTQVDSALRVWREEAASPYGPARISDYVTSPTEPPPGPERDAALAALRAADAECEAMNRDLMRRAILAALES